jgi:hypothetical protein
MRRRNAAMAARRTQPLQVILAADELAAVEEFHIRLEFPADRLRFENSKTGAGSFVSCLWCSPNAPFTRLEMLTAEWP